MENNRPKPERGTVIKIIQSVLCIAYIAVMALQTVGIYTAGEAAVAADPRAQIYTPEAAAEALLNGLPLLIPAVIVTAAAAILGIRNSEKPFNDPTFARDITVRMVKEPTPEMKAERAKQKKLVIGGRAAFALSMIPIALYMTNADHFAVSDKAGLENVIASMVLFILPWTIIGIGLLGISFILIDKSVIKETELAKACTKTKPEYSEPETRSKTVVVIRCIVLAAAAAFIIIGIINDGASAMLTKAINICTECIGLG